VHDCIIGSSENSTPGPDGVQPRLVKRCVGVLAPILTRIFNESVQSGVYPDLWKVSNVTPLYKSGDVADVDNYRPISKYCVIGQCQNIRLYYKVHHA